MSIDATGIHHITLRVGDLERSRAFFQGVLGFEVQEADPELSFFQVGDTLVALRPPLDGTAPGDRFSEYRVGVDHLAFAVPDRAQLERAVEALRGAHVATEGIETDPLLGKEYVCFRDPDNVQWEFYSR
jgi:glyoxylase I family protein